MSRQGYITAEYYTNEMLEAMWRFRPGSQGINESMKKPAHLRLVAGQAKEGMIQWYDYTPEQYRLLSGHLS